MHCPLSGPVLIYISLLNISFIIEYVMNKRTLNLEKDPAESEFTQGYWPGWHSGTGAKKCSSQLTDVLTDIFKISLAQSVVPGCLETFIIIPLPKRTPVTCLDDYHPVALSPIIMKCFEWLVMCHGARGSQERGGEELLLNTLFSTQRSLETSTHT